MTDDAERQPQIPGLPPLEQRRQWRVWDSYFTPAFGSPGADGRQNLFADIERSLPAMSVGCFEKACVFAHVGLGTTADDTFEQLVQSDPEVALVAFRRWPELLLGMIQLNPMRPAESEAAIRRWLRDGPMLGVYFRGGGLGSVNCLHADVKKLVAAVCDAGGVIIQHTWRRSDRPSGPDNTTTADLAQLARQFPQQNFICAHAGGEWEQGLRAVRDFPNVLVETSGFDATAGFIEMAVREVGAERIIFGSHLPSRSLGTELTKVTAAQIGEADRELILGSNYRRLLQPFLHRQKRLTVE